MRVVLSDLSRRPACQYRAEIARLHTAATAAHVKSSMCVATAIPSESHAGGKARRNGRAAGSLEGGSGCRRLVLVTAHGELVPAQQL